MIERELWSDDELEIFALYNYMCVHCDKREADVLHEMIPKSLNPRNWRGADNQVPLCINCHDWAHNWGTRYSRRILLKDIERWTK